MHVLIVEARFYEDIADELVAGAVATLEAAGANYERLSVPGAFEIPGAIAIALDGDSEPPFDAFIALGCVIRGETTHYDYVCGESARGLMDLAVRRKAAIGYGILTVDNRDAGLGTGGGGAQEQGPRRGRGSAQNGGVEGTLRGRKGMSKEQLSKRSAARLEAAQALYQIDIQVIDDAEAVILEFLTHRAGALVDDEGDGYVEADRDLFADLVRGVARRQGQIDKLISSALTPSWPLERLERILRVILRCGVYELLMRPIFRPRSRSRNMSTWLAIFSVATSPAWPMRCSTASPVS